MKSNPPRESLRLSTRAREIRPFIVMEILERAMELERLGRSIIHLEVGEPDFDTPAVVREAGIRAIREGHTHYTHSLGRPELREAIADRYRRRYQVPVDAEQVVVTVGSSGAMLLAFAVLLDPGDEVLIPDPGYPCYPKFVRAFEGRPVPVEVKESSDFQYSRESLEALLSDRRRVLLLNSPSNPTGTIAADADLGLAASLGETKGLQVISDEIYHGLVYEGQERSMLEFSQDAIVISGFSKLFAMTGWRLGYAVFPRALIRPVQRLQQNLFISAPDFGQLAALAALTSAAEEVRVMREEYDRRRKYLLERLGAAGIRVAGRPRGAFYLLIDVSNRTRDVYGYAFRILEEAGVALTPGTDFGRFGEGYLRICYASGMDRLEEALDRLTEFFAAEPPETELSSGS